MILEKIPLKVFFSTKLVPCLMQTEKLGETLKSFKSTCSLLLALSAIYLYAAPALCESMGAQPSDKPAVTEKPLAFSAVNEQLLKNYTLAKDEIRAGLGPIIVCSGNTIALHKGKNIASVVVIKPRYTGLKEVAHITLGTFVLLTNHTDDDLSTTQIDKLKTYKTGIEQAASGLEKNEGLAPADNPTQKELIDKTLTFLGNVIDAKRVSHADLQKYVRSCASPDMHNAYEAAGTQIAAMDEAVTKWHKAMTADEWKNLYVVIMTGHMPRQQLLSFQYFSKLLNQPQEGDRIIVAEGLSEEQQAIDLLLTHILDRKIAVEFFQDPWRMHRDLLSDGAKEYLEKNKIQGNLDQ